MEQWSPVFSLFLYRNQIWCLEWLQPFCDMEAITIVMKIQDIEIEVKLVLCLWEALQLLQQPWTASPQTAYDMGNLNHYCLHYWIRFLLFDPKILLNGMFQTLNILKIATLPQLIYKFKQRVVADKHCYSLWSCVQMSNRSNTSGSGFSRLFSRTTLWPLEVVALVNAFVPLLTPRNLSYKPFIFTYTQRHPSAVDRAPGSPPSSSSPPSLTLWLEEKVVLSGLH